METIQLSTSNNIKPLVLIFSILFFWSCTSTKKITKSSKATIQHEEKDILSEKQRMALNAYFVDANKEKILGNTEKAIYLFEECLKIDKNNDASYYELSKLYSDIQNPKLFNYDKALLYAEKSSSLKGDNIWYNLQLAYLYEINKKLDEAAKIYKKLIKISPYNIDYYSKIGQIYEDNKKYKEAIETYDDIEKFMGINDYTSFKKSDLYLRIKQGDKAAEELENLIKKFPYEADYYQKLAECYLKQQKEEDALKVYERLKQMDVSDPNIHLFLASYYENKGQTEKSFLELKEAFKNTSLDIDKKIQILLNYFVALDYKQEYKPQAFELLNILLSTHPEEAKAYSMAGDFYMKEQKLEEAKKYFTKALEFDKTKYPIWNQLFFIYAELKAYDDLVKITQDAIEYFPNQSLIYYFNGFANIQIKQYDNAINSLNTGKDITFDNTDLLIQIYALLGDAYNSKKDYTNSDLSYQEALKLDTNNTHVLNNYAYYLSVRKANLLEAKKMSKKTLDFEPNSSTFLDTYAWILYQLEDYEEALIWMEKALASQEENSSGTIVEHYGDILFKLGRKEEAFIQWNKAKNLGGASEFIDQKINSKLLVE